MAEQVVEEVQERRPAKRGRHTRERLIEVAEQLIAQHGVAGFELKEVAARVGIRSPSIFAHFKGRDDLAEEVARRVSQRVVAQFRAEGDTLRDRLETGMRAVIVHLSANPAHVRILLADLARQRDIQSVPASAIQMKEAREQVRLLLTAGQHAGVFRYVRSDLFISQMLGAVLGALAWYGWDREGVPQGPIHVEDVVRETVDMAWSYLQVRESAIEEPAVAE